MIQSTPTNCALRFVRLGQFITPDRRAPESPIRTTCTIEAAPTAMARTATARLYPEPRLGGSAFPPVHQRQHDGDDEHRDREVDHPPAALGVGVQNGAMVAFSAVQPFACVDGDRRQRGDHRRRRQGPATPGAAAPPARARTESPAAPSTAPTPPWRAQAERGREAQRSSLTST